VVIPNAESYRQHEGIYKFQIFGCK